MTTDPTLQSIDPDADVVRRVRQGERDAFELLMRRHNVRVFRAVRAFVMDGTCDPAALASTAELGRLLEEALGRLPEPFRIVFVLRAVEQLPVREVAECLELEEATVKTRLFRAKALLQGLLARHVDRQAPHLFPFPRQRCDRVVANVLQRLSP